MGPPFKMLFVGKIPIVLRQHVRFFMYLRGNSNLLKLHDRGILLNAFPEESTPDLYNKLIGKPQCLYCGFDPTADSLHIGNLLAVIALLHAQRGGHHPIALVGGATALIGDPSGKTKDRIPMEAETVQSNASSIQQSLHTIFTNHEKYFWNEDKKLPPYKILNNAEWYGKRNVIEFLSTVGRHFRMGTMLRKESVKNRLSTEEGMCLTEFTYQIFQSYDWLHLHKKHNCDIQIGGNDQSGNIVSGYDLIRRVKRKNVYGLTVPLVTTLTGDKLGKTDGNAVWLNSDKTTAFELYQFYINRTDAEVEKYLKLFTFISDEDIAEIMRNHREAGHLRKAQKILAEQVTTLVHGEEGLSLAKKCTEIMFGSSSSQLLADLNEDELGSLFKNVPSCSILLEPGTSILNMVMQARCFGREADARRISTAGGLFVNQRKVTEVDHVLLPGEHILPNHCTMIRVGKKNYYMVKWLGAGL